MWTIETIQRYIADQIEENTHLEYKAAAGLDKSYAKKFDISKDISSFANSDGGVVIYGVRENTDNIPGSIEPIDKSVYTKEWLEQVINDHISPRIHGIEITPIVIDSSNPKGVIYVVDVPKGQTAYQATDKRYYRRFNFLSVPMDDWEIKDIINRQNRTTAYVRFRPKFNRKFDLDIKPRRGTSFEFDIVAYNHGIKAIYVLDCMLITTENAAKQFIPPIGYTGQHYEMYYNNEENDIIELNGEQVVLSRRRMPILSNTFRKIGEVAIWSDFFIDNMELELQVSTDDNCLLEKLSAIEVIEEFPGQSKMR